MNRTLSIKEIFHRFPSLYFERDPDDRKSIPTKFFRNFLFQSTDSYRAYRWILRKTGPPLFFLFF